MKVKVQPKAASKQPVKIARPASLFIHRNGKGEVDFATFNAEAASEVEVHMRWKIETVSASSATTAALAGKMLSLSGGQSKGGFASRDSMTKAERSARGKKGAAARWGK